MSKLSRSLALLVATVLLPAAVCAQAGTFFVEGENVGVGTPTPATSLHVKKNDGTARVQVEESSTTIQARELFRLVNNGGPFFIFQDSSTAKSFSFAMSGPGDFIISHQQTAGVQLRLNPNGNLTIAGSLFEGSSREIKEEIRPVDQKQILDRVVSLPLATWKYRAEEGPARHLGPMAEDFHEGFGLGRDGKTIAALDASGVALAAIQGLHDLVQEQRAEIHELRQRLAELETED